MNGNDILGIMLLVAFVAMAIYFQIKSKQLEKERKMSEK